MNSINKQKKYLSENLIVESLRMYGSNQEDIKQFSQAKSGSNIAEYLMTKAWNDDGNNDTRVFLVRDKTTRKIVYYYALNCGILYKELNTMQMTYIEEECVVKLIKAERRTKETGLNEAEREAANHLLSEAYELFERIEDSDRATALISYALEQAEMKEEREEAATQTGDSEFTKNVQETYPAIDIKFLCKDANYVPEIDIEFKLGVYVFWEIIVPHILKISELVGCKYVYLFAADNSENGKIEEKEIPIMYSQEYDMDAEEKDDCIPKEDVKKLVAYYINNLKFRPVSEYTILKPHFERRCYTLIQDVAELAQKRELIWSSHDEDNEMGLCAE